MNTNTRNARVVICLILAMTAGARILLWLEPAPAINERTPLTAISGAPVHDLLIEYAQPGDPLPEPACLVLPDGRCDPYGSLGPHVRLVVVGTQQSSLPDVQKQSLLAALGSFAWGRDSSRAETPAIRLDRDSDVRFTPNLPPQARELSDMLVAKRFID